MNVAEVTVLYECLRTVIKHFESSIKNKDLLDEAMEILELQPLHLMSWCQTRMGHFLKACKIMDEMLPAVYDAMFTKGIRVEERDLLFTAKNIYIIKLLADIQPSYENGYLRKADKSNLLVSTVFNTAKKFADSIITSKTPSADSFQASLRLDKPTGNLYADVKINNNVHTIMLNHPHKRSRNISEEERLQKIKDDLTDLKVRIMENIQTNVHDQCGENTFFYCWSGLDLTENLSTSSRIERLRDLITLFCTSKVHTVGKYNGNETSVTPQIWNGYTVSLLSHSIHNRFIQVCIN